MAAARAWEAADGVPPDVARALGGEVSLLLAIPEHRVEMPKRGRPSQCDIFALVRIGDETCAVAVEAKVSEPFGPTVGEWMVGAGQNKKGRMDCICELLGRRAPAETLRYQLFHRTAAAVVEARRFKTDRAAMVVQSFSPEHRSFKDFVDFAALFGLEAKRDQPLSCRRDCR